MIFGFFAIGVSALFFVGCLIMLNYGRRLGLRYLRRNELDSMVGLPTVEAAVFALIGLLIAFAISGVSNGLMNVDNSLSRRITIGQGHYRFVSRFRCNSLRISIRLASISSIIVRCLRASVGSSPRFSRSATTVICASTASRVSCTSISAFRHTGSGMCADTPSVSLAMRRDRSWLRADRQDRRADCTSTAFPGRDRAAGTRMRATAARADVALIFDLI